MSNKALKVWTFAEASKTIPYVQKSLADMREKFILIYHYFRRNDYRSTGPYEGQIAQLGEEGRRLLRELESVGVIVYHNPLRGIALYPFVVNYIDCRNKSVPRQAYYIYKDSRDTIDSFIFEDHLEVYGDLYGWEAAIPENWKTLTETPEATTKC